MGFGHSHKRKSSAGCAPSQRKRNTTWHISEGKEHHEAPGHAFVPGVHHHADKPEVRTVRFTRHRMARTGRLSEPAEFAPSAPAHPEGYAWPPVEHADYNKPGTSRRTIRILRPSIPPSGKARGPNTTAKPDLGAKVGKGSGRCLEYWPRSRAFDQRSHHLHLCAWRTPALRRHQHVL